MSHALETLGVRTGVPPAAAAAGCHCCCCDSRAGFQGWISQISKEVVGLSRRNQATHETLKEEGFRYAPLILLLFLFLLGKARIWCWLGKVFA